jgi:hypothetical protein
MNLTTTMLTVPVLRMYLNGVVLLCALCLGDHKF